ncbi:MAG TPA: hypothetical protein VK943_16285, partial [Arenibaculum sp.]|nr:hypothetical protein [Arenibaculum sp.]
KAAQESGYDPAVKARGSSATGLYQFIESTWLRMVDEHGAKYGLGDEAASIARRDDGRRMVADPERRDAILELRKDPRLSALMAAEYARENRDYLAREVGGTVGGTELYMAHFLGAGGAAKFLSALRHDPGQPAAALLPQAASANRAVFYEASGRPRTVAEIYDRFAGRFGGGETAGTGTRLAMAPVEEPAPGRIGGGPPTGGGTGPLSLFTVMMLSQLGMPDERDAGREEAGRPPRALPPRIA